MNFFEETITRDIMSGEVFYHNGSLKELINYIENDDQYFYDCLENYQFNFGEKIAFIEIMKYPAGLLSKVVDVGLYDYLKEFSNFKELEKELLEQKNESSMTL